MAPPLPIVLHPNAKPTDLRIQKAKIMGRQSRSSPTNLPCSIGPATSHQKRCLIATNMTGMSTIPVALLNRTN